MNWLAHLFLSEPDTEFRLGNLLADCIERNDRPTLPQNVQRGIHQHLKIDAFTDTHPIVRRSRSRLTGDYRHTRGILIDIFYDHLLARNFHLFSPEPLESFTANFYTSVRAPPILLPPDARQTIDHILQSDRLTSYRTSDGLHQTLRRLSKRLSTRLNKPIVLDHALPDLQLNFQPLEQDFLEYFPTLQSHLACDRS